MNSRFDLSHRAAFAAGMHAVRFISILLVALFVTATAQAGSDWVVSSIKGDAKIVKAGIQPVALTTGDQLSEGDRIVTGETGRAVLTRGGSTIVVAPGTEMSIPVEKSEGLTTRILQKVGTLFLNVEKKKTEHFEVVTPYLAAVVKGTSFTVNVDRAGAAVHVLEGLVQVADAVSGQAVFVRPGQTATRDSQAAGLDLKGQKGAAPGQQKKADAGAPGAENSKGAENSAKGFANAVEASNGKAGGNGKSIGRTLGVVSLDVAIATSTLPGSSTGQLNRSEKSNAGGNTKVSSTNPGNSGSAPGQSGSAPGQSGGAPGNSGSAPGQSGGTPGQSASAPGQSGGAPGQSGGAPGNSGNAPGQGGDNPGKKNKNKNK